MTKVVRPAPALTIPECYAGARIYARGLTLGALYVSSWSPGPTDPGWVDHPFLRNCWRHQSYPGFIVARHTAGTLLVAHLARSTPKLSRVEQLAKLALGPTAAPFSTVIYPLAFRLPMEGPGVLQVPKENMRCRRVWPAANQPAYVERIEGVNVELRITATTTKSGLRLTAEGFIGGAHERARRPEDGPNTPLARALLFDGDARHVLTKSHEPWRRRFTARVMDRLLAFAYERSDVGLSVSQRRFNSQRRLGVIGLMEGVADVDFDIWLPQTQGRPARFTGNYVSP